MALFVMDIQSIQWQMMESDAKRSAFTCIIGEPPSQPIALDTKICCLDVFVFINE